MEAVIKGLVVLIANLNLKFLSLERFNSEGSNQYPELRKLEFAHIPYIVVLNHNFITGKNGIFMIYFMANYFILSACKLLKSI